MATNRDFRDLFFALSARGARFIVVGAHAVMTYTAPRYTKDVDIWSEATPENAQRTFAALVDFGAPIADLTALDLQTLGTILQIGVEPNRIDILTSLLGVEFASAWERAQSTKYDDVEIRLLGRDDLIANKRAVGRPQDLLDVAKLEQSKKS